MNTIKGKGFTLIELLVVISLFGLLAAMILIGLRSSRARAFDVQAKSDMRGISTAIRTYAMDNNEKFPLSNGDGTPECLSDTSYTGSLLVNGNLLSKIPRDEYRNQCYYYQYNGKDDFSIGTNLPSKPDDSYAINCNDHCSEENLPSKQPFFKEITNSGQIKEPGLAFGERFGGYVAANSLYIYSAAYAYDGKIFIYNASDASLKETLIGGLNDHLGSSMVANEEKLVAGARTYFQIFDADGRNPSPQFSLPVTGSMVRAIHNNHIYITNRTAGEVYIYDFSGILLKTITKGGHFGSGLAISGENLYISDPWTNNWKGAIYVFDLANNYAESTLDISNLPSDAKSIGEQLASDEGKLFIRSNASGQTGYYNATKDYVTIYTLNSTSSKSFAVDVQDSNSYKSFVVNNNRIIIGGTSEVQVLIYNYEGTFLHKIDWSEDYDQFGAYIAVTPHRIVIGAPQHTLGPENSKGMTKIYNNYFIDFPSQ